MAKRKPVKRELKGLLDSLAIHEVDGAAWHDLLRRLAPVKESRLRRALRDLNVPVAAPYGGVRQSSFGDLETSLLELAGVYLSARETGNPGLCRTCRDVVIEAKNHAGLAAQNPRVSEMQRLVKSEMREWMLVWLENPEVFAPWVALRTRRPLPGG